MEGRMVAVESVASVPPTPVKKAESESLRLQKEVKCATKILTDKINASNIRLFCRTL